MFKLVFMTVILSYVLKASIYCFHKVNSGFDFLTEILDHHLSPVAPEYISVIQEVFKMTSVFTKFK